MFAVETPSNGLWIILSVLLFVVAAFFIWFVGCLPGHIARGRGHENAQAIRICGLIGILIWPCWIVALIWAFTGPDRGPPPDRQSDAAQRILNRAKHRVRHG
jgi:cytochrome b561